MRALLNTTTLHSGGGLQVGLSIIGHALRDPGEVEWRIAASPYVAKEMQALGLGLRPQDRVLESPAKNRSARRALEQCARSEPTDAVVTVFGPAYARFDRPHVLGVADPWVTHPSSIAYATLRSTLASAKRFVRSKYKAHWFRHADRWWVEAECARVGLHDRLGVSPERVAVIPNTCAQAFRQATPRPITPPGPDAPLRVLTLAHPYPHKDLMMLPRVAAELRRLAPDRAFEFVGSAPSDGPEWRAIAAEAERLGVGDAVKTVGRVAVADCVELYRAHDVGFMPTVLETYSAAYPEAMAMGLPIVATDLDFARDICGDAALFFKPRDPECAARALLRLVGSAELWRSLAERGRQRVNNAPTDADRYRALVALAHEAAGRPVATAGGVAA